MRYCLVTYGSRGDVQPFIYLARGLKAKGHEVILAAPGNFQQLVEGNGVDFYPLFGDAEELVKSPDFRKVIKSGSNIAFVRQALRQIRDKRLQILDDIFKACKNADMIISIGPCIFYIDTVAEKLGKKWALVQLNPPMVPTREFPMRMFNFPDLKWFNYHTYILVNKALWQAQKKEFKLFRETVGLPVYKGNIFQKVVDEKIPLLHAFSPELVDRPKDWDEHVTITGFLVPGRDKNRSPKLTEGLEDWMNAGEKPLYIGFGSIPFPDNRRLSNTIKGLLEQTDLRIIFCRGWSDIPDVPPSPRLLVIDQADHAWLLPRCRAAVIHGGIGTLAAVMQAGIPVIIASLFVDQPAWGKIIERKNLGVHIPWRKLSAGSVINALQKVRQELMATSIEEAHARLLEEDGIGNAIAAIEAYSS